MKRIEEYDDLLWGYIDSSISSKEREELELKLAENNHLRERLNELKSISSFTKENIILSPKENFTKLVMSKIEGIDFQPKKSHWLLVLIVIMTVMGGGFYRRLIIG